MLGSPKEYDHINLAAKISCVHISFKTLFIFVFSIHISIHISIHKSTDTCTFIDGLNFFPKTCKHTVYVYLYIHTHVSAVHICIIGVCSDIVTDLHFGANITPKEVSKHISQLFARIPCINNSDPRRAQLSRIQLGGC